MEAGNVYRVIISKQCAKGINKAPTTIKKAVDRAFGELSCNPYDGVNIKKMKGEFDGYYRYRIGSYRLIYRVDDEQVTILAVLFGSRGDI